MTAATITAEAANAGTSAEAYRLTLTDRMCSEAAADNGYNITARMT